ncbi:hypothetical protein VNO80_06425 [Phaseolus coccineus]|uniref:Uncharacterized protein n=1 Tax=Phaseolus coccineus TaxID=3886 RepID=A0AAN9NIB6_PHACN
MENALSPHLLGKVGWRTSFSCFVLLLGICNVLDVSTPSDLPAKIYARFSNLFIEIAPIVLCKSKTYCDKMTVEVVCLPGDDNVNQN